MREKSLLASNFLLILLLLYFSCILQISSFFPRNVPFVQHLPSPMLWIPPVLYLCLYRKAIEGILTIYVFVYALSPLTIQSTGGFVFSTLVLFSFCQILKIRMFWPGVRYFMVVCGLAVIVFHLANSAIHFIFESHVPQPKEPLLWILQAVLTPVFGFFQFRIISFFDRLTHKTPLTEVSHEAAAQ